MEHKGALAAIAAFFAGISALLGDLAIPIYILVGCNLIDYVTGIMAARRRGERISSEIGIVGITKKVGQWLLVMIGWMLDVLIESSVRKVMPEFEAPVIIALFVAFWLIANEMLSILENVDEIGVPIPGFLRKIIKYFLNTTEQHVESAVPVDVDMLNLNVEDAEEGGEQEE